MNFAPKQNWALHEKRCRPARVTWLRRFTPQEAFSLYEDLCRFADSVPRNPNESARWNRIHRGEKLQVRRRMVDAFRQLDRIRSG